jgi:hypothetical protein
MPEIKINQLATENVPETSDVFPIADPVTGLAKKLPLSALNTLLETTNNSSGPYIARLGGVIPGSDQTTALQNIFNNANVKHVIIDNGDITISGTLTVPASKTIEFVNNAKLIGSGVFIAHTSSIKALDKRVFSDALNVRLIPDGDFVKPEIFGALSRTTSDGINYDNADVFNKLFKSFYASDANASSNLPGRCVIPIDLSGVYNIGSTVYIRNCTPTIRGTGQVIGSGFWLYGDQTTKRTRASIVPNDHYSVNQNSLWSSPVGPLTVTFTSMANNTTVYFTIVEVDAADFAMSFKRGSFVYNGANSQVLPDYRPSNREVIHFATTYVESGSITLGSTPNNFTTRVLNATSFTLTSLKYSGLEALSGNVSAAGNQDRPVPAYGAVPPYSVKVTLSGVSNGTTLYLAHITDGVITTQSTFVYNGADTEIKSNYIPQLWTSPKKFLEFFVIKEAAPILADSENRWVTYGNAITFVNKLGAGKNITSIKFNADEQMQKYIWQDSSMFNLSGVENSTFENFTVYAHGITNPLMLPYSAFTSYFDYTNQVWPPLTQREQFYDRIHFTSGTVPGGNPWQTFRSYKSCITIDGIYANNDFFRIEKCVFEAAENAYYNNNQQAVSHVVEDCVFNIVDWCIVNLGGSVYIKRPFMGYGTSQGFIKVIGSSDEAMNYNVEDYTTEGIEGWFFLYNQGGAAWNVFVRNPSITFWNRTANLTKEFNLIAGHKGAITNVIMDGGIGPLNSINGGGDVKISIGRPNADKNSKLVFRDTFNVNGILDKVFFDMPFCNFMLEISNVSPGFVTVGDNVKRNYSGAIVRTFVSQSSELWAKYKTKITSHGNRMNLAEVLANQDFRSYSTGTKWLDIGQDGLGTFGIAADVKWHTVPSSSVGEYVISNALPANKNIYGVGIKTGVADLVLDTSTNYVDFFYRAKIYVGDRYDYKRWGVIDLGNAGGKINNRAINPVIYQQNEDLVLTLVYSVQLDALDSNGDVTVPVGQFGTGSTDLNSIIGRKIWIVGGTLDGLQATVSSRISGNKMGTTFSGNTLSSPSNVTIEVEGKINSVNASTALEFIVSTYYAEGNRNVDAVPFASEAFIPKIS